MIKEKAFAKFQQTMHFLQYRDVFDIYKVLNVTNALFLVKVAFRYPGLVINSFPTISE